ncbi:hypothetical protein QOZ80_2AG0122380 [Eleusine coracana subsp. coracana]|nr:hypothetical protein QOZ80_2AG0122380 [Eleusine coracana subsp. coracana]
MTRISCFPALLLAGRRKKHHKVADATKVGFNDGSLIKVKPVEFIAVVDEPGKVVPAAALDGGDEKVEDNEELEFHAANKSDGADVAPEQAATDASPRLMRSCSNIETKRPSPVMPARSRSYSDLMDLPAGLATEIKTSPFGMPEASPASVKTSRTADRVMLKKRSSSQVLPSRSRKLWWRLFLWSHRNLHRPRPAARPSTPGQHGGYTSDTHEEDRKNKKVVTVEEDDGSSPSPQQPIPTNQEWVAFCADNSLLDRVSAWVSSIETDPFHVAPSEDDDDDVEASDGGDCAASRPRALEVGEPSSAKGGHGGRSRRAEEVVQANSVVQSLNAFSTVAHISGMGLKVVPMIAPFSSLRSVNLSSNFIVHISPGSLPKGLHSLDLSRNKITSIEGLRELTKLRVLNLSYNRISRIGHGLSNCTAIRELYLAGNKISDVEGLHRLLKLAVLDLSFNKITTAKALGQLVANYHSLLALNLIGNPVQANVGDDALRRAVTGLLPSLAYLNKQPVKPQRSAREVATDSVARAALTGGGGRSSQRRRGSRRLGSGSGDGSFRSRSRGKNHGSSSMKK